MERNHKIGVWIVILLLIAAAVFAYLASQGTFEMKHTEKNATNTPTAETTSTTSNRDMVTTSSSTIESTTTDYHVKADYPAGNAPGAAVVRDSIETSVKNFEARATNEMQDIKQGPGASGKYEKITTYQIYHHGDTISYVVDTYEYTLGANGISVVSTFVFNQAGSQLSLEDVVGANSSQKEAFLQDVKQALLAKDSSVGIFADAVNKLTLSDLNNFYLTDEGVNVAFSQYDVAPGASGIVTVTIPYTALQ